MPLTQPIFMNLPQELQDEIIKSVSEIGAYATASKYKDKAGMTFYGLYKNLNTRARLGKIADRGGKIREIRKGEKKPQKLTEEEKQFLEDIRSGKKDLNEISKLVAVKVFEKMLKYPDNFKFYDFYQSQMLQLKQEEAKSKNTMAMELINRLFNGQLPPTHCPNCGHEIIKLETVAAIEEGEVIGDE